MSLPISSVVNVNIAISPTSPPKVGFGIAAFVTSELPISGLPLVERVSYYNSVLELADIFLPSTEVYKAASAYFSQSPAPESFGIIAQYLTPTNAVLNGAGGVDTTLPTWQAISDGSFEISFDGLRIEVQNCDFSFAPDMDSVATVIETAIRNADIAIGYSNATCIWDSAFTRFIITSGNTAGTIDFTLDGLAGTSISIMMKTDLLAGGFLTQGRGPENIIDALTAAEQADPNWYGVLTINSIRDTQECEDVTAWVEARVKIYTTVTHNPNTLISGNVDNIATRLRDKNLARTTVIYSGFGTEYVDAAMFGKAFTVDFAAPDSVITLKFKTLSGITTENITSNQKKAIDEKRANVHLSVGGVAYFAESFMSTQLFFDERHGVDWLTGELEYNVFNYLRGRVTKVPLTDAGTSSLVQQVIRTLDLARRNGLIASGTTIDGVFLPNGYAVTYGKVADLSQGDRDNRVAPPINFVALLAGAIHSVQVNGVLER